MPVGPAQAEFLEKQRQDLLRFQQQQQQQQQLLLQQQQQQQLQQEQNHQQHMQQLLVAGSTTAVQYQVGAAASCAGGKTDAEALAVASSFKAAAPLVAEPDRPRTHWHHAVDDDYDDEDEDEKGTAEPEAAPSPDKAAGGARPTREQLLELSQRPSRWAEGVKDDMAD